MQGYRTLAHEACAEYTVKKSRFIGRIAPVQTPQQATDWIGLVARENRDAAHNCFAYFLHEGNAERCSDNGEPQGTAGVPILDVLKKAGLEDAAIVVTRYFGGILLGAGGLVRAYSHAAAMAVQVAEIVTLTLCSTLTVRFAYPLYDRVQNMLADFVHTAGQSDFAADVTVTITIASAERARFEGALTELSGAKAVVCLQKEAFAFL